MFLAPYVRKRLRREEGRRVLYVGQSYYHTWYLSRELRKKGWTADVLNWNDVPGDQMFFHGEDIAFTSRDDDALRDQMEFYVNSIFNYDIFHFSNAHAMHFGHAIHDAVAAFADRYEEVRILKKFGRKIAYSNNSCNDGVSQTSFAAWDKHPVCEDCNWRDVPSICSDEVNLEWGRIRNELIDYQCCFGANRADYNDDPSVREQPQFYCLDPDVWRPDLEIPEEFRIERTSPDELLLYHAVGNFDLRTEKHARTIKSTHIYLPLIEELQKDGYPIRLIFFDKVPNKHVRYYQVQADIMVDMLKFGWFGANGREALMLGRPFVCYLRPSWIEQVKQHNPGYAEECPVVSATPDTVREVLIDLIENPEKRREIGQRSRAFALKWHSSKVGAETFDQVYSDLLDK